MTPNISHPKISQELVQELQGEPTYNNSKAFAATYTFLRRIIRFSRDQKYAYIPAKTIKEWFASHKVKYTDCLKALVKHEIIEIDRQYIVGQKTRGYKLTEKGARLMCSGQLQYLQQVFTDKALKRQMQKQASYHRTKAKKYKHSFLEYIHNGLLNYTFSTEALEHIATSNWGHFTKLKALMDLTSFAERDFVDLKYNEADIRCWNEFAGMNSELRRFFSLGDLRYRFVIDIRSCHPLFLAHYLVHRSVDKSVSRATPENPVQVYSLPQSASLGKRERSERLSIPHSTTTNQSSLSSSFPNQPTPTQSPSNTNLHYDGGDLDILAELNRWNALFSDPDTDPKSVLIRDLGYTREQAKAALNQTINGSKQYRKFIQWFQTNYPLLFVIWNRTDKKGVGVSISTHYETYLMQDETLYELAEDLGLHLTYEFDGCGIMCREDDAEALAKIQQLIAHVQDSSEQMWGIRPVVVVKTATGEQVDMQTVGTDATERPGVTKRQRGAIPATRTVVSASRRPSNRSARPSRKPRGSSRPSHT